MTRYAPLLLSLLLVSPAVLAAPSQVHLSWDGDPRTTMTVVWRSSRAGGEVQYGPTTSYGSTAKATSRAYGSSHLHEARLTGLKAGQTLHYRCGQTGDWSKDRTFTTAPASPTAAFRYVAFGDSRSDDTARAQVRAAIEPRKPAFLLHTGDFVSSGWVQSQWDTYFATMEPLAAVSPLMAALGNHEGLAQNYYDQFALPDNAPTSSGVKKESYYSFDYGNTHVVALSTEHSPSVGDSQYQWLRGDLIAAAKKPHIKWIVAYAHRPPYSSGTHGGSSAVRSAWSHVFESLGVDVTFWGHDHTYERTKPLLQGRVVPAGDGVIYIVTGGAGAPLYTAKGDSFTAVAKKLHHFVEINVSGDQMRLEARDKSGNVFDTLVLKKSGPKSTFVMEGTADGAAKVLGSGGGELKGLRASFDGRYLYVATGGMPAQSDHFVLLSAKKPPSGALSAAPWSKKGQVWAHDLVLTMEQSSGWSGWQAPGQGKVIGLGSTWKYHDQGQDLGNGWTAPGYNDASWPSGPAQLGYGDGDEATKLKDASPNDPSAYFRRSFNLAAPVSAAQLKVVYDDGVAVWINGQQVLTRNMGNGTGYAAWASAQSSDNAVATATVTQTTGGPFKVGQNVVAVMVKQVNGSSSDLSFDLELALEASGGTTGTRASNPAGAVMEGTVDLKERFGAVPASVFLAAVAYGTKNGDALAEQIPKGNGNGDLEAGEWITFKLTGPPKPDAGVTKNDKGVTPNDYGTQPADQKAPAVDSHTPAGDTGAAGLEAGPTVPPATDEGCGCAVGAEPRGAAAPLALLLLGVALLAMAVLRARRG